MRQLGVAFDFGAAKHLADDLRDRVGQLLGVAGLVIDLVESFLQLIARAGIEFGDAIDFELQCVAGLAFRLRKSVDAARQVLQRSRFVIEKKFF